MYLGMASDLEITLCFLPPCPFHPNFPPPPNFDGKEVSPEHPKTHESNCMIDYPTTLKYTMKTQFLRG